MDRIMAGPYSKEELGRFQRHQLHLSNIRFLLEMEEAITFSFLNIMVKWKPSGLLGHTIYRKSMHADLHVYASSHHHPSQKHAALLKLICWKKTICDLEILYEEMLHLKRIFRLNGYSTKDIHWDLNPRPK
jgi:hypothetical protein